MWKDGQETEWGRQTHTDINTHRHTHSQRLHRYSEHGLPFPQAVWVWCEGISDVGWSYGGPFMWNMKEGEWKKRKHENSNMWSELGWRGFLSEEPSALEITLSASFTLTDLLLCVSWGSGKDLSYTEGLTPKPARRRGGVNHFCSSGVWVTEPLRLSLSFLPVWAQSSVLCRKYLHPSLSRGNSQRLRRPLTLEHTRHVCVFNINVCVVGLIKHISPAHWVVTARRNKHGGGWVWCWLNCSDVSFRFEPQEAHGSLFDLLVYIQPTSPTLFSWHVGSHADGLNVCVCWCMMM